MDRTNEWIAQMSGSHMTKITFEMTSVDRSDKCGSLGDSRSREKLPRDVFFFAKCVDRTMCGTVLCPIFTHHANVSSVSMLCVVGILVINRETQRTVR